MAKDEFPSWDKILVPFDGSKDSRKAVRFASAISLEHGSQVTILHVYSVHYYTMGPLGLPQTSFGELEQAAKDTAAEVVSRGVTLAAEMGVHARSETVQSGSIVESIVDFADAEGFDLIVMGTRGNTGFRKLLLGSVSTGVVAQAKCPVTIVR